MMRPPTIEMEAEWMRKKTEAIPMDHYEGEWQFKAYFPRNCKVEPSCRINKINFKQVESDKANWNCF